MTPDERADERAGPACTATDGPAIGDTRRDTNLLELRDVTVNYGGIQALREVNLTVRAGEIVTLIGANGAGKSTTLRTISRLLNPRAGQIIYDGRDIGNARPDEVVRWGIAQCPEGRRVLTRFSVLDNLDLGAYTRSDRAQVRADIDRQFALLPDPRRAAQADGGHIERRRAADARHRPRADEQPPPAPAR